jgi:hypothetical protein
LGCPTRSRALRFTALVMENAGFFFLAITIVPRSPVWNTFTDAVLKLIAGLFCVIWRVHHITRASRGVPERASP